MWLMQFRQVKIEPLLAAGGVFWGQWIIPEAHVTCCGVVTKASYLPFAGVALCLCVSESWHSADFCSSITSVYANLYRF